jgi:hypothetical protein
MRRGRENVDESVLRKRRKEAEKDLLKGRIPGLIQKPPVLDFQSSEYFRNKN